MRGRRGGVPARRSSCGRYVPSWFWLDTSAESSAAEQGRVAAASKASRGRGHRELGLRQLIPVPRGGFLWQTAVIFVAVIFVAAVAVVAPLSGECQISVSRTDPDVPTERSIDFNRLVWKTRSSR